MPGYCFSTLLTAQGYKARYIIHLTQKYISSLAWIYSIQTLDINTECDNSRAHLLLCMTITHSHWDWKVKIVGHIAIQDIDTYQKVLLAIPQLRFCSRKVLKSQAQVNHMETPKYSSNQPTMVYIQAGSPFFLLLVVVYVCRPNFSCTYIRKSSGEVKI